MTSTISTARQEITIEESNLEMRHTIILEEKIYTYVQMFLISVLMYKNTDIPYFFLSCIVSNSDLYL